ncbi:hypothetical protein [Hyunsoonleella ulvae]|uniref:hypothetical protein n=1 Tax=Hyunsoonleella ulvae TaxID=2799948 RepID=UPI001939AD26|nr:hypothetical protein [Hyunsoonleella ulvae]
MKIKKSKGFKPFILRVLVVLLSASYLLGPLHKEVGVFLHEVTHLLEIPDYIVSHSDIDRKRSEKIHSDHEVLTSKDIHSHQLLNLLNDLLEDIDTEKNSEDSIVLALKIDKHTQYQKKYKRPLVLLPLEQNKIIVFITKQTRLGYLNSPLQPPQVS